VTPVLEVIGLSKTFGGQRAIDAVSLSIEPGEIRALVGQNGCGKSTLIKILAGFHVPDEGGSVLVEGLPLAFGVAGAGAAMGLRFVHQDLGLIGDMDAVDNIALGKGYQTNRAGLIRWKLEATQASDSLKQLGYDIDVNQPVGSLVISERTAIAIARALSGKDAARLLVLDEPTANLPNAEAERLYELVRTVSRRGIAVLFVSHHFDEVFELATSVTVMRDGRMIDTLPVTDLTEDELIELVVGHPLGNHDQDSIAHHRGDVILDIQEVFGSRVFGISMQVRAGEVVGIAGITGSGREEVLGLIFGANARQGIVQIEGVTLPGGKPDASVAAGIALVPAERLANAAFPEFPLRENVTVVDSSANLVRGFLSRGRESSDVQYWLNKLDVRPPSPDVPMTNLSGGNQQKVVIARWLREKPRVMLLDEPTQGVDVGAKSDIHRLIDEAASVGTCVVVASTDHEELVRLCHRVLVIREGCIVEELQAPGIDSDRITALTIGRTTTVG
jgi:ribose transport system ATP-binding protein